MKNFLALLTTPDPMDIYLIYILSLLSENYHAFLCFVQDSGITTASARSNRLLVAE